MSESLSDKPVDQKANRIEALLFDKSALEDRIQLKEKMLELLSQEINELTILVGKYQGKIDRARQNVKDEPLSSSSESINIE